MQDLQQLLDAAQSWPTILNAQQELDLLAALRRIGDQTLLDRFDDFSLLLSKLDESHAGGGIFEITDENCSDFDAAAFWIDGLARFPLPEQNQAFLRSVAETLRARF